MRRPLAIYGEPVLRMVAKEVAEVNEETRQIVQDLLDTIDAEGNSIGLSAPQIFVSQRIFIAWPMPDEEAGEVYREPPLVMINPVLSDPSDDGWNMPEACMSIPGLHGHVIRPDSVTVEYLDLDGKKHTERFSGFKARIVMHENDHLNGVLYFDRMHDQRERRNLEDALRKMKKETKKKKR